MENVYKLVLVLVAAAMFVPIARAGPIMASEEVLLASVVPTTNPLMKVGVVAQSSVGFGLNVYAARDFEADRDYQSREWVRNRERVRITKWPDVVVASIPGSFNNARRRITFSSGNAIHNGERA